MIKALLILLTASFGTMSLWSYDTPGRNVQGLDEKYKTISDYVVAKKKKDEKKKIKKEEKSDDEEKDEEFVEPKINPKEFKPVHLGKLLNSPDAYIDKKVRFRGEFSSYTTLALDYMPAYRSSKEFLSFCIFRPNTIIPLSELKLAYPVEYAKNIPTLGEVSKGDLIEVYGQVFSAALDEPWLDVLSIKKIRSAPKNSIFDKKSKKEESEKEQLKDDEKTEEKEDN